MYVDLRGMCGGEVQPKLQLFHYTSSAKFLIFIKQCINSVFPQNILTNLSTKTHYIEHQQSNALK